MSHLPDISEALLALGKAGVEVAVNPTDPARLRFRPVTAGPDLLDLLQQHQRGILDILAAGGVRDNADAEYDFNERLGVADGLGMPTHLGSSAWLVAVGESIKAIDKSSSYATLGLNGRPQDHPPVHSAERNQPRGTWS